MKRGRKIWIYPLLIMGVLLVIIGSCNKDKTEPKKIPITSENAQGKWYLKNTDAASGMTFIFYLDNGQDSATIGLLNGSEEVELMKFAYSVSNDTYQFVSPPVDTTYQNALQIYLSSYMGQMLVNDNVYLQDGNLCFVEGSEVYRFTPSIPNVAGGKITGTLLISNGSFAQGMAMIVAVDVNTNATQGTFVIHPGQYSILGLVNGNYNIVAVYIPKNHASDFLQHNVSEFPKAVIQTPIAISGGNVVTGVDMNINLANYSNLKKTTVFSSKYSVIISNVLHKTGTMFKKSLK
jgi:hypothetical protein